MRTLSIALGAVLAVLLATGTAYAAPEAPPSTGARRPAAGGEPGSGGEPGGGGGEPGSGEPGAARPGAGTAKSPTVPGKAAEDKPSPTGGPSYWQDIKVVPRKLILKQKRFELMPVIGYTLNDNLIQHFLVGAGIKYHITDVLAFGISGHYYIYNLTERNYLVGLQQRVLPTLNKYIFSATVDASYMIAYGKFAVHNKFILQFGAFLAGGVGVTMTEVIPRNAAHEPWQNYNVTVHIGLGFRMFITKWMTLWFAVRDYMMPDKYEPDDRTDEDGQEAKKNGEWRFINNFVFQLGVTFFLPTDFKYTTFK
ncbi:MAG: outer membrane beta-barrel domain-containing protein [bacterium]